MTSLSTSNTFILLLVCCSFIVYKYVLSRALFSPLASIPAAHWSAPYSSIWIKYHRVLKNAGTFVVHDAHQKHGPVVRLAPNEVSINCVDGGLRTVYAGGYEKQQWYDIFKNYGVRPMFAMDDRTEHSKRKRMVSNLYGKSFLQASKSLEAISTIVLKHRLVPALDKLVERGQQPVEFTAIMSAITMDFVCAYTMGLKNGSNFLGDLDHSKSFNYVFHELQRDASWPQELPLLTKIITQLRLQWLLYLEIPDVDKYQVEGMLLDMCDRAEATCQTLEHSPACLDESPEDFPTVYRQLRTAMLKELRKSDADLSERDAVASFRADIASELLDHTMAGYDTSSITLAFHAWQLSRPENLHWQEKLYDELRNMPDDPRTIDSAPILHAVLMETLRLDAAIPGNQPRVTPANATLGPPGQVYTGLPAGVRVQAQAWSLHRNPDVFPQPDKWLPERWLDASEEHKKEMLRWFWSFGSGGRMCVGSNLAMLEMKAVTKTIWTRFTTTIEYDGGMKHTGGYVAPPFLGKDGRTLELWLKKR